MGELIKEGINIAQILRREVDLYAGNTHGATLFSLLDDAQQRYGVVLIPENRTDRPAWMTVMARIIGDYIVIEEDTALDRPLVDALVQNGGVPREQIILAYQGEALPTA